MSNTIEDKLNFQRKVITLKSNFISIGIRNFPRNQMIDKCPHKDLHEANAWIVKSQNIWHLRVVDETIYNLMLDVYENEKVTRNLEVKE